jgi:ATP-dependent helicase HrpA
VEIPLNAWPTDAIPAHLRPRIEVVGNDQKTIGTSRDLATLRQKLEQVKAKPAPDDSAWTRVAQQWERTGITTWNFGVLPARITVSENGPVPTYAWPGLTGAPASCRPGELTETRRQDASVPGVSLRLFRTEELARQATLGGIQKLVELALSKDFAWLQRDLRALNGCDALAANLCPLDELQADAFENVCRHILPAEVFSPLNEENFIAVVQQTRLQIPGLAMKLVDQVGVILRVRKEIQQRCGPSPTLPTTKPKTLSDLSQLSIATKDAVKPANVWADELENLLPRHFLAEIPFAQLAHVPRYLKALATRMERAKLNPVKDKERAQLIAPYLAKLKSLRENPPKSAEARAQLEEFRWMVEEYKVSVFAQELGTAIPVSPKRLDEQFARI